MSFAGALSSGYRGSVTSESFNSYEMSPVGLVLYEECAISGDGDVHQMMRCIANRIESNEQRDHVVMTHWLLVLAGALVFFMQAGFAMLCAGCVRKKNVQNTMLKNLLDACGAAVAFFCCGYAFAFSSTSDDSHFSFIGTKNFFCMGDVDPAFWFFQYAFSATAVTIVAGTLAERCQMTAYLCYSVFLTGLVYPIAARAIWSDYGFLSAANAKPFGEVGVVDFAGSGVVHTTGGMTALVAAHLLGPRRGRFTDTRGRPLAKPREFPGHSIALQLLGTMILWFGWYGFNPGSALLLGIIDNGAIGALAAVNTTLAAASGAICALFTNLYLEERRTGDISFKLSFAMNGVLSGLVAITAGCATVDPWAACVIGLIAGWIYIGANSLLLYWRIDDAVDAIPVHLFNGIWGLIATGLFSSPSRMLMVYGTQLHVGVFYSIGQGKLDFQLLINQIVATLFVVGWPLVTMTPFFVWLNYMGWFRADSLEELVGLDLSYHGSIRPNDNIELDDDIDDDDLQAFVKKRAFGKKNGNNGENTE